MPHRRGIAYSVNTCKRHNPSNVGGFERVHRMLAFYDKELERRSMTSRPLSKSVADVSAFLSNLPKDAYEEEKKLVQEYKEGLPIGKACDWHFCNCTICATTIATSGRIFNKQRMMAKRNARRHYHDNGFAETTTNFGASTGLTLKELLDGFRYSSHHSEEGDFDAMDTDIAEASPNDPRQPQSDKTTLELRLPWNDGADVCGQRGSEIGIKEDDLSNPNAREVLRIIMDILERKVLYNRTSADVTGELQNWKQSTFVLESIREMLPEDENQMLTLVDKLIGIRQYIYKVCRTKLCGHIFRCESRDLDNCPRCGEPKAKAGHLHHFSLIETLRALYKTKNGAKLLQYKQLRQEEPTEYRGNGGSWDVFHTKAWKDIMESDPLMPQDERNIGIQICTDGFQIFKGKDSPSMWPISVSLLNLPPWIRYRATMTFMVSVLPMGIDSIDSCLEPLMDELNYLYQVGLQLIDPMDPTAGEFTLRATLVRVTVDYRGLPKIYLWAQSPSPHGCFFCHNVGFRVHEFNKPIYPGAWRWLSRRKEDMDLREACSSMHNGCLSSEEGKPITRWHESVMEVCKPLEAYRKSLNPKTHNVGVYEANMANWVYPLFLSCHI